MKKWIALVLALVLCGSIVACNTQNEPEAEGTEETSGNQTVSEEETMSETEKSSETEEESTEPAQVLERATHYLADSLEDVKVYGRSSVVDRGIACDYTASGIEFDIFCEGAVKLNVNATAETYYTVFVDGVRQNGRVRAMAGMNELAIASFDEQGSHNIRILKQTEAQNSLSVLVSLDFTGYFEEMPADKDLYIEFLGDSITCGYGNLVSNGAANPGNAANQDGTQAFAYLAAEALDADFSMVSVSGIGVQLGYRNFVMENCYKVHSYYRETSVEYDFVRTPDVVVINLGTNDQSKGADTTAFSNRVKSLIETIWDHYGKDVIIIWAHDMMKDGYKTQISEVLTSLGGEDAGLYMCQLTRNTSGGNGHPNKAAHLSSSVTLADFIRNLLK